MIKKWFPVLFLTILFVSFPGLLWAQGLYSYSYLSYNESTGYVSGYSALSVNYDVYLYYNVEVIADLINEDTEVTVDTNYNAVTMGNYAWVEAPVSALADFGVSYRVEGGYFVDCYYQGATGMWFDYYNYSYWPPQGIYAWNWFNFSSGGTIEIWYSSMTVGHTYDTKNVPEPTLTVSSPSVTRGDTATFTVNNAGGATITNWQFRIPADGKGLSSEVVIDRSSYPSSTQWGGMMVAGGTAYVTVSRGGSTALPLQKSISVSERNFSFPSPAVSQGPGNPYGLNFSFPPLTNDYGTKVGETAAYFDYEGPETAPVSDDGPNKGMKFVTSMHPVAYMVWAITPDLSGGSEFCNHQCGIKRNNIQWATCGLLRGFVTDHELTHVNNASTAYNGSNNPKQFESWIVGPSQSEGDLEDLVRQKGVAEAAVVESQLAIEPCNGNGLVPVNTCSRSESINWPPYGPPCN